MRAPAQAICAARLLCALLTPCGDLRAPGGWFSLMMSAIYAGMMLLWFWVRP